MRILTLQELEKNYMVSEIFGLTFLIGFVIFWFVSLIMQSFFTLMVMRIFELYVIVFVIYNISEKIRYENRFHYLILKDKIKGVKDKHRR